MLMATERMFEVISNLSQGNYMGIKNTEIIEGTLMIHNKGFDYNGENLKTYEAWRKAGYQVQKGQKAFIQTQLWTPCKTKQENTEVATDSEENKQNKSSKMFLKKSSLFTIEQVQPIE